MRAFFCLLFLFELSVLAAEPMPLIHAHAHNDYEHARPLLDALDYGFCSVEADVWLVDGRLLVAHDRDKVKPERTLQALYLEPLRERVGKNGGRVYRGGPTLTLLIDVKSEATNTYLALRQTFEAYGKILTAFHANRTETNAITIIISGNRARELMETETVRHSGYDGRLADLDSPASLHFMPLISDNWTKQFNWKGSGSFPAEEKQKLKEIVGRTHQQGRRLRLWATPDSPAVWKELLSAGVDLINADDLDGLQRFLLDHRDAR